MGQSSPGNLQMPAHRWLAARCPACLADLSDPLWLALMFGWLFATILWAALKVVHHADCLAVKLGEEKATRIAAVVLMGCVLALPVPALASYYGQAYGLIMELGVVPGVLLASYLVLRSQRKPVLHRASFILKIEMFLGIIALALART